MEEQSLVDPDVEISWVSSSVVRRVVVGAWAVLAALGESDTNPGGPSHAEP